MFFAAAFTQAPGVGWILAIVCAGLGLLAFRDAKRGWRIRYDIPERAYRAVARGGIGGEVAQASIDATLKEAKDPNRKRYAFDD